MPDSKTDLEERIRHTYKIICDYERVLQTSSDPLERERAQDTIKNQEGLLERYLKQYARLCHGLNLSMEQEIVEIALIAGVDLVPVVTSPTPTPAPEKQRAPDRPVPFVVTETLRPPVLSPAEPAPPPPPTPTIPITIAEWQHTLANERNTVFGEPAGYWCYVRGDTYRIGGWKEGKASADIALRPFWVARYPVTHAQYAQFIAARGYRTRQWWTPHGWQWMQEEKRTQPRFWDNGLFNDDRQPVVGVTWYEAVAFAQWLNAQLQSVLPSGYAIRLPTEAEWEAAAAYDAAMQRRPYPWGEDEPTPERAVYKTDEQGRERDRSAPVGSCPSGAAACGALDMAGTVWEWMTSDYDAYPAQSGPQHAVKDVPYGGEGAPLRGGSWLIDRTYVRCEARLRTHPARDLDHGFRDFAAPHSH